MNALIMVAGSVLLGAIAQIALKHGVSSTSRGISLAGRQISSGVMVWGICFVAATALWLGALRHADISYAYPLLGAGYVLVTVFAALLLRERVSRLRWLAILIITAGVIMVGVNR